VTTNLDDFRLINPCGLTDRPVTSLEREVAGRETTPALESVAHEAARQFGLVFGEQVLAVGSLQDLRSIANAPQAPPAPPQVAPQAQLAPPQVAEDTPLQVPAEVERLAGKPERPVRA
jgi:lipoyl(octanoyl) transferase